MTNLWKVVIAVAVTLVIVGGGTYYYMNGKAVKEKNDLQARIDELNAKVDELSTASGVAATATTEDVNTGTTATTDTVTTDPTAGWKTFASSAYKFSFKYPSSYKVDNGNYAAEANAFVYSSQDPSTPAVVIIQAETSSLSLDAYLTKIGSLYSELTSTTIGGKPAYEAVDHGMISSYGAIVKNGNIIYRITLFTGDQATLAKSKATLTTIQKQILSTLIFTN